MPTMETRSQNPVPDSMQANNCLNPTDPASLDSTDRTRNANGGDWQEEVYQKIKAMKDLYLHDLNDMHQIILGELQHPTNEQLEKLKVCRNMLERFMAFLQIPKQNILPSYKDKLGTYEKQIFNFINSNRRKPEAPQQHKSSLDSTDRTRNANGGDWQEEVYQKINAMKDLYLHDLNYIHQKVLGKMQHHDSLPKQPKNDELERLKIFKNMLERFMAFLQIPKQDILPKYKDKLGTYERQIFNVVNSNRRKPEAPQQHKSSFDSTDHTRSANQHSKDICSIIGMETLKRHLPFSGHEEPQELKKMVVLFEEKISTAATSQSDSLLTMETRSQNPMPDSMQANNCSTDPDRTQNANGGDWQEEVYQKINAMKDLYLHDLNYIHQKVLGKMQHHDSLPKQPKNEELEKLKVFKNILERFMAFLQIPKQSILANYKDKLSTYEKQIAIYINSNRRKPEAPQQHKSSFDSTDHTRSANGGDWQEEVYQKNRLHLERGLTRKYSNIVLKKETDEHSYCQPKKQRTGVSEVFEGINVVEATNNKKMGHGRVNSITLTSHINEGHSLDNARIELPDLNVPYTASI